MNPSTNKKIGEVSFSTEHEIQTKVKKANNARELWKDLGVLGRVKELKKVIQAIQKHKDELAKVASEEMGMPLSQSLTDVDDSIHFFQTFIELAKKHLSPEVVFDDGKVVHTVHYEPVGTVAVISPWNFPVSNFVWSAAQQLLAGNTVVYKTSEECPLFGKLLEKVIHSAGLPEGVFAEVYGDGMVGDFLVHQDINMISFTGSTAVGKYLYKLGGERFIKVLCELGGSAPGIVFADADLDAVVENVYGNRFTNCGQMCDALKRLIVHKSIFNTVVEKLEKKLASVMIGDALDMKTEIGPLVSQRQLATLEEQIKDAVEKGAKVVIGGKRVSQREGFFYEPTILTQVTQKMRVWNEEVFGPVLPVVSFETDEEAIALANDTSYGLGSYVYAKNVKKAQHIAAQIQAGMVSINGTSYINACSPFGGYKNSGMGREHGKFGFAEMTQVKIVAVEK